MDMTDKNYGTLAHVLNLAYERAAKGKGRERHGKGRAFHEQPIVTIPKLQGNFDGLAYQIMKKLGELKDFPEKERRVNELLDVIVYASAMVLYEIGDDMAAVTSIKVDSIDSASTEEEGRPPIPPIPSVLGCRAGKAPLAPLAPVKKVVAENDNHGQTKPAKTARTGGDPIANLGTTASLSRLRSRRLLRSGFLPGVDGGNDYIILYAMNTASQEAGPELLVNSLADVAVDLAKNNVDTEVMINLIPCMLTNYRTTMVGELLKSEGIRVIDADKDSDTITLVYDDI